MLDKAPNQKISSLLRSLDQALISDDVECATNLFQEDCYWRDLVAFTWNIRTMEGRDQVRDMLQSQLALTSPSNSALDEAEQVSEANGVTEAWVKFETNVARGYGHIRLKDGR